MMLDTAPDQRRDRNGWNVAATLCLAAAAMVLERVFPTRKSVALGSEPKASPSLIAIVHDCVRRTDSHEVTAERSKNIILRLYSNVGDHRILALAAGMTYYSLLAIFPALAALVAIYGLFSDPGTIAKHLDELSGFIPSGAIEVARDQLTRAASKGSQALGLTSIIGLVVSLWSANAAMKSLFDTLNIVYDEKEKRGFLKLNALSLSFTLAAIAFVLTALAAIVILPIVLNYLWLSQFADLLFRAARWPVMFLVVALSLAVIYRFGASRQAPRWRWISWGSVVATLLWLSASALFSWYAANFGKFDQTYGSLGGVVGFMTWLWISAIVILLGAELDAEIERQTRQDTATDLPTPEANGRLQRPVPLLRRNSLNANLSKDPIEQWHQSDTSY